MSSRKTNVMCLRLGGRDGTFKDGSDGFSDGFHTSAAKSCILEKAEAGWCAFWCLAQNNVDRLGRENHGAIGRRRCDDEQAS